MTSHTITGPQPTAQHRLESVALAALLVFVAALQLSIAVAHILLTATLLLWGTVVIVRRERPEVPAMFWPLGAYAVVTLVASAFSLAPSASFADSKQLVLFLIIPVVYRLARGATARTVSNVIVSVGAVAAALGIMQYGILEFDHLGQRPQGTMGHYMTYSGLLMLVIGLAAALILFSKRDRTWPALVMPALLVALRADVYPQRLGRRLRGHRPAARSQRPSVVGGLAGPRRGVLCRRAAAGDRAALFDVRPAGPDQPRSPRDGPAPGVGWCATIR